MAGLPKVRTISSSRKAGGKLRLRSRSRRKLATTPGVDTPTFRGAQWIAQDTVRDGFRRAGVLHQTDHMALHIFVSGRCGLIFWPVCALIQQGASFNLHKVEIPQSGLIDHSELGGVLIRDVDFDGYGIVCGRNDGVVKPFKPVN